MNDKTKFKFIAVRIPVDLYAQIEGIVKDGEFENDSQFIRAAIRRFFQEHGVVKV